MSLKVRFKILDHSKGNTVYYLFSESSCLTWLRVDNNEEAKFMGAISTKVRWLYEKYKIHFIKKS